MTGFFVLLKQHYGAFVGCVVALVLVILVSTYIIREVCYSRYGIDVCPGAAGNLTRARRRSQVTQDQSIALEVQQSLEREQRRDVAERRRAERRAKYEVFLKPYTMVIREDDFVLEQKESCNPTLQPAVGDDGDNDENGSFVSNDECGRHSMTDKGSRGEHAPSVSRHEHNMLLTLPVTTQEGKPRRVEANCSICLMEYEEGESVIWSTRKKCPHAFHDDCILMWLSKGKKRCPCCRNFFVPGQPVDNQKVIVDNGGDERNNEELDGDNNDEATEDAIIEEIRISIHSMIDVEAGPPRRRASAFEPRLTQLPPEENAIVSSQTL